MAETLCPRCARSMHRWEAGGVVLDHCGSCKGLWFDQGELTRHFANLGNKVSESELAAATPTSWKCPRCAAQPLVTARLSSIEVDACERCRGMFLELGEVHQLLGALNRARYEGDPAVAGFDNFALGLYIGANLRRG
jgi:Zn-finger nucleic acid-binding protein